MRVTTKRKRNEDKGDSGMTYEKKQRGKAVQTHKGCGGLVVVGPYGYEGLVCVECAANINTDEQIEQHPEF